MTKQTTLMTMLSVITLALSSNARAQPVAQAPDPETVVASPAAPSGGANDDPNVDRGFLLPTAMTQPAGSVTYNNYELLLHGLTYAFTDNVQGTVTVLSPITEDMPFVGFGSVKAHLPVNERVHLAVQGSVGIGHSFASGKEDASVYTMGAGAFASLCLREDCSSIFSGSVTYQLAWSQGNDNGHLIIYGGSIVHGVSPRIKLLLEVASAAAGGGQSATENIPVFLASYGLRFHNGNMAADVGFVRPIGEDTGEFLMGLPFASVSYRWQ